MRNMESIISSIREIFPELPEDPEMTLCSTTGEIDAEQKMAFTIMKINFHGFSWIDLKRVERSHMGNKLQCKMYTSVI